MATTLAQRGLKRLRGAWKIALLEPPPASPDIALAMACDAVFQGKEVGYRKAIIIQAAGKAADVTLDAQAMQKGNGTPGTWDAREFAKKVFVRWNIDAQNPFSHAPDPYISNPYRVPRFDEKVREQRKRPAEFDAAVRVMELLNHATTPAIAFRNLVAVMLALRRFLAGKTVEYPLPNRASLAQTMSCLDEFVAGKSGGTRLQAAVFGLFEALCSVGIRYADIRSRHVNAADASTTAAGDIGFEFAGAQSAVEVKDRALDTAELAATIQKCRIVGIREMIFVIRARRLFGADLSEAKFEEHRDEQFSSGLNLYIEPFERFAQSVLTIVGENGRRTFLEKVGAALDLQSADVTHRWAWAALVKSI